MINENEFKDIPGFEGKYGVSQKGEIISYKRWRKPKTSLIKGWISKRGYQTVMLIKSCRKDQKKFMVHQLVAQAFLKNYSEKLTVNHIDGNKLNNNIENLECITMKQNLQHAFDIGLHKRPSRLGVETIQFIREAYASKFCTQKDMANYFKVSKGLIQDIISFKTGNPDGRNHYVRK